MNRTQDCSQNESTFTNTFPIKMYEKTLKPLYSNKIYLKDKGLGLKELTFMSSE
jgi:hypothetical protein